MTKFGCGVILLVAQVMGVIGFFLLTPKYGLNYSMMMYVSLTTWSLVGCIHAYCADFDVENYRPKYEPLHYLFWVVVVSHSPEKMTKVSWIAWIMWTVVAWFTAWSDHYIFKKKQEKEFVKELRKELFGLKLA